MDVYSEVAKTVEPKKKALNEAQATLDVLRVRLRAALTGAPAPVAFALRRRRSRATVDAARLGRLGGLCGLRRRRWWDNPS